VISSPNTFAADVPEDQKKLISNSPEQAKATANNLGDSKDHFIEEEKIHSAKVDGDHSGSLLINNNPNTAAVSKNVSEDHSEVEALKPQRYLSLSQL